MTHIGHRIVDTFTIESDPPDLEPYSPELSQQQNINEISTKCNLSNSISSNMSTESLFTFDRVYGIIPKKTLEIWTQQEHEAEFRRINSPKRLELPPVRYSMINNHVVDITKNQNDVALIDVANDGETSTKTEHSELISENNKPKKKKKKKQK